jgi:hypothetical protein
MRRCALGILCSALFLGCRDPAPRIYPPTMAPYRGCFWEEQAARDPFTHGAPSWTRPWYDQGTTPSPWDHPWIAGP